MRSAVDSAPAGTRAVRLRPVPRYEPPFDDELAPQLWSPEQQLALTWPRPVVTGAAGRAGPPPIAAPERERGPGSSPECGGGGSRVGRAVVSGDQRKAGSSRDRPAGGGEHRGADQGGGDQCGGEQCGGEHGGGEHGGGVHSGSDHSGGVHSGSDHSGGVHSGKDQGGSVPGGSDQGGWASGGGNGEPAGGGRTGLLGCHPWREGTPWVDPGRIAALAAVPVVAGPSGEAKLAVKRFVHLCVEVLNGYRPATHLRRLSLPAEAAEVVAQGLAGARRVSAMRRARRPGDRRPQRPSPVAVIKVNLCQPRGGAVEAAIALVTGERTWAMALRLELHQDTWFATALRLI
ncbi:Voltage-dependent P/Q-type calcium channel subunit alpha-1A [Actinoplanes sp. SE50]|uniref:Rv3235 family protein n=1 Tax=unclassified Actinoplanes TaxID=2626549 RepID=UPI00023EC726|nr:MULTISPECIES: Rv3235 family protein [unclassified Actinoplanes]AEV81970.1 Voltage-dependent P/Q-type calcium channel subunit alpha-1A [Actinoplanes sp. SE50/110]ATO80370.1 Voltage-dependent P/Q-type calcium channel subunit alpha-1A [Actinoplanes sp. SE50]SLL97776.1 hypothetical protein ACSP50_0985 [Actinoplanes sp. SE50/110]